MRRKDHKITQINKIWQFKLRTKLLQVQPTTRRGEVVLRIEMTTTTTMKMRKMGQEEEKRWSKMETNQSFLHQVRSKEKGNKL